MITQHHQTTMQNLYNFTGSAPGQLVVYQSDPPRVGKILRVTKTLVVVELPHNKEARFNIKGGHAWGSRSGSVWHRPPGIRLPKDDAEPEQIRKAAVLHANARSCFKRVRDLGLSDLLAADPADLGRLMAAVAAIHKRP
jgi:hypothetical protein